MKSEGHVTWRFTKKHHVSYGKALYVIGNVVQLGSWDINKAIRLSWGQADNWFVDVNIPNDRNIEYKFIEGSFKDIHQEIEWEKGSNRQLNLSQIRLTNDSLSMMTFNIRYDNEGDGKNQWKNRKDKVLKTILDTFPCVIGLQEALPHQRAHLQEKLKEYYTYIGIPRDLQNGEECGIFFLNYKFFLIDSGFVWFNQERRPGALGYDAVFPRYLTYVVLQDQHQQEKSIFINTHLDHQSRKSQQAGLQIILETIDRIKTEDDKYRKLPIHNIYVMGDFNISDDDPLFKVFEDSKWDFVSARKSAKSSDREENTFHGFQGPKYKEKCIIDHVLYHSQKRPCNYSVLRDDPTLSDHYPVFVEFTKDC